jgi:chromate transporter
VQRVRYYNFLKDVAQLSVTSFGGPQAHIAHFHAVLVKKRQYITEEELLETNALCQVLPGPTSTQTLSGLGYKLGGPNLAYLTLLIWILPSVIIMTAAAILLTQFHADQVSQLSRFIQPMAVGFVSYAAYTISLKTVTTKRGIAIMILAGVASYFIKTPFVFPAILLVAGAITALNYRAHPREEKKKFDVRWDNFKLWAAVLVFAAVLGGVTKTIPSFLPIRLFENFYRNGSLVFGGGQVLAPMLYTEFVQFAKPVPGGLREPYLSPEEFLTGYGVMQSLPGPLFSFGSYIGALAMHSRGFGIGGQIGGALMSAAGIFLPGTFLIFFMVRIWDSLKKFRVIRASLEGINAANAGLVAAAAIILFQPLENSFTNFGFTIGTFCCLAFTKIPSWSIVGLCLLFGFVLR